MDLNVRQDGIYNAGFRGSGWAINDVDNRFNGSFDTSLNGPLPSGLASWFFQVYGVEDVDALNQPQTFAPNVATHTSADLNTRTQDLVGQRFQPRFNFWKGNDLLLGWDHETEMLRSTRYDLGIANAPVTQPAPTDNNQHVNENAFYFEDAQTLFDDRLTIRGGLRKTLGTTTLDATPNVNPALLVSAHDYHTTTYSGGRCLARDRLAHHAGCRIERLPRTDRDRTRAELHHRQFRHADAWKPRPAGRKPASRWRPAWL